MKLRKWAEQREKDRVPHQALVRYSVGGQDEYLPARMFNFSSTGMYLELQFPRPSSGRTCSSKSSKRATETHGTTTTPRGAAITPRLSGREICRNPKGITAWDCATFPFRDRLSRAFQKETAAQRRRFPGALRGPFQLARAASSALRLVRSSNTAMAAEAPSLTAVTICCTPPVMSPAA